MKRQIIVTAVQAEVGLQCEATKIGKSGGTFINGAELVGTIGGVFASVMSKKQLSAEFPAHPKFGGRNSVRWIEPYLSDRKGE
jgi:hypothetical protein